MNANLINKLNIKFDFQEIETSLERYYLKGVDLIEFELKKCEYISKLEDDEIDGNKSMPFDNLKITFLAQAVEFYLKAYYYNLFPES